MLLYLYCVGLCRNAPFLQIAYVIRCLLTSLTFGLGMLVVHMWFLLSHLGKDDLEKYQTHDEDDKYKEGYSHGDHDALSSLIGSYNPEYSPPYMGLLIIIMYWVYVGVLSFFFTKLGFTWFDYRVPILIYTICFIVSPLMVTIVLSDVFNTKPLGYDLFQIMVGTFILNCLGIGTPKHMERLLEGKLCPLGKDEVLYAVLHYGMA